MKMPTLTRSGRNIEIPPGLTGTARVDRRTASLLRRLKPGDIAVIEHVDMDRATAQQLLDAEVAAVVNVAPMISGRYANLGPELLVAGGVMVLDGIGADGLARIRDGAQLRLHDGVVHAGEEQVAAGRQVDAALIADEMSHARDGLATQLESFTHNSAEFLRREEELLLHGRGFPRLATTLAGKPSVVVMRNHDWASELRGIRQWISETSPVLIAVDRGADALVESGLSPDVLVLSADLPEDDLPSAKALRAAKDVVIRSDRQDVSLERFERLGVTPHRLVTGAATEDAALLLAHSAKAELIVAVGQHATLDEFLDRQRAGLASNYLTRLAVGPSLVDAATLPSLYSGRIRPWHLFFALVVALLALAVAIGITPVGQEWAADGSDWLTARYHDVADYLRGKL